MSVNIRNRDIVQSPEANAGADCRLPVRGPVYSFDLALTNDVVRKAKPLAASLGKLQASLDAPCHQPIKEDSPMPKAPLHLRLHFQPHMHELVRFVS